MLLDLLEPGIWRVQLPCSKRRNIATSFAHIGAGGRVPDYRPDVVALVCAAITHEAHHRGQIWARELGAPISAEDQLKLWEWDKRWMEVAG